MKMRESHTVSLSSQAVDVLRLHEITGTVTSFSPTATTRGAP
jgi:hypothetical protein